MITYRFFGYIFACLVSIFHSFWVTLSDGWMRTKSTNSKPCANQVFWNVTIIRLINLEVKQELLPILERLCGQTDIIANPKIRKCNRSVYRECDFEPLILADHQVILETAKKGRTEGRCVSFLLLTGSLVRAFRRGQGLPDLEVYKTCPHPTIS